MRSIRMHAVVLLASAILFALSPSANAQAELTIEVDSSAEVIVSGSNITYTITVVNEGTLPASPFTVVNQLPEETTFVSCDAPAGALCSNTGSNVSVSFLTLAAEASAVITIVAIVNCALSDGSDIINTAELHSSVPDPDGDEVENETVFVQVSNPPPAIKDVTVTPSQLWPPNHKWADVTVGYRIEDNCGPVVVTLSVTSNEPVNGTGDGDTAPDWLIIDDHLVRLRAERAGTGTGRIYTITITATDNIEQSASATATVGVPHSR